MAYTGCGKTGCTAQGRHHILHQYGAHAVVCDEHLTEALATGEWEEDEDMAPEQVGPLVDRVPVVMVTFTVRTIAKKGDQPTTIADALDYDEPWIAVETGREVTEITSSEHLTQVLADLDLDYASVFETLTYDEDSD